MRVGIFYDVGFHGIFVLGIFIGEGFLKDFQKEKFSRRSFCILLMANSAVFKVRSAHESEEWCVVLGRTFCILSFMRFVRDASAVVFGW